jgi:hypothetical protein
MPKISVIGSGPAGCIFSYALLRKGFEVTLYSDRTPDQWLNHSPPTGTAYLYGNVIDIERELGMDHWSHEMFGGHGVLLDFCPKVGMKSLEATGLFEGGKQGCGIDQRMRVHRWLTDFESVGGKLVIEAVTPERVDKIAQESDLTVLAAGKADLGKLIPRDPVRSVYNTPQRHLGMTIVRSKSGKHVVDWFRDRVDYNPVKFDFFAEEGEYFWVPYQHKTAGATYCILWEARPGSKMDIFSGCKSGAEVLEAGKKVIKDMAPWEHHLMDDMEYVHEDKHGWLVGKFPPTVREPYGRLPSGKLLMPIGDTAITFDPIGGQGGNNASRNAKYVADAIIAHGDKPYDEMFLTKVNRSYWNDVARPAWDFNNILLEPITPAGKQLLMEVARNKRFASDAFFSGFPAPSKFFPYFNDMKAGKDLVRQYRDTPEEQLRANLPIWTKLINTQVTLTNMVGRTQYPSPGAKAMEEQALA